MWHEGAEDALSAPSLWRSFGAAIYSVLQTELWQRGDDV
jgi:hypothetical protein